MMKKVLIVGVIFALVIGAFSGISIAKSTSSTEWGFKKNIDLGKEFGAYLTIGYDKFIADLNENTFNTSESAGKYHVDSHSSSLTGNFKSAAAMKKNGDLVNFDMGSLLNANMSFTASGTFPYANTVWDVVNASYNSSTSNNKPVFSAKKMNVNLNLGIREKTIVSGSAMTDGAGNITSAVFNSNSTTYIHVKGDNLPIPLFLYAGLEDMKEYYTNAYITVDFTFYNATSNSICFLVNITGATNSYKLNINDFSISYPGVYVTYKDMNGDNVFDSGDLFCINGNVANLTNPYGVMIQYNDSEHGVNAETNLWYYSWEGKFYLDSLWFNVKVQPTTPQGKAIVSLVNEDKNMPMYDNFDFTIVVTSYSHISTKYAPYLPLLPTTSMDVHVNATGMWGGSVNVIGLQEKYKKILETMANQTFPWSLTKVIYYFLAYTVYGYGASGGRGYNTEGYSTVPSTSMYLGPGALSNGTIDKSFTVNVSPGHIDRVNYDGQTVYRVSGNEGYNTNSWSGYYYYSPSKGFIVGGGVNMGFKQEETVPTTYQDAEKEVNGIKSVNVAEQPNKNKEPPFWQKYMMWEIIGAIIAAGIVIAVVVLHRRKKKVPPQEAQEFVPAGQEVYTGEYQEQGMLDNYEGEYPMQNDEYYGPYEEDQ